LFKEDLLLRGGEGRGRGGERRGRGGKERGEDAP